MGIKSFSWFLFFYKARHQQFLQTYQWKNPQFWLLHCKIPPTTEMWIDNLKFHFIFTHAHLIVSNTTDQRNSTANLLPRSICSSARSSYRLRAPAFELPNNLFKLILNTDCLRIPFLNYIYILSIRLNWHEHFSKPLNWQLQLL